jgi:hypothetical protein
MPVWARPGGVLASATANGGKIWPVTLGTTTAQVIPINGGRQSLLFHNPGSSTVYVAPATTATGGPLVPSIANPAGSFEIVAGGTLVMGGECQSAWQGFWASAGSPLTIMESNV